MLRLLPCDVHDEVVRIELCVVSFRPPSLHQVEALGVGSDSVRIDSRNRACGSSIFCPPAVLNASRVDQLRKLCRINRMDL